MKIREASLVFKTIQGGRTPILSDPDAVVRYLVGAFDEDPTVEWLIVMPLSIKNQALGRFTVSKGGAKGCTAGIREILRPVILANAPGFILAHNHPSGDPSPSKVDRDLTKTLYDAACLMGISMLDHVIVGDDEDFFSFSGEPEMRIQERIRYK